MSMREKKNMDMATSNQGTMKNATITVMMIGATFSNTAGATTMRLTIGRIIDNTRVLA